jgi:hypothetical protein
VRGPPCAEYQGGPREGEHEADPGTDDGIRQLNPPADATGRDAGGAVAAAETAAWRKSPARRDCGRLVLDSETPALDDLRER